MVERFPLKEAVEGSSPSRLTNRMTNFIEVEEAFLRTIEVSWETALRKHGSLLAFGLDWWLNQRTDSGVETDREAIKQYRKRWTDLNMSGVNLEDAERQMSMEDPDLFSRFEQLKSRANVWIAKQMLLKFKEFGKQVPNELIDFLTLHGDQD